MMGIMNKVYSILMTCIQFTIFTCIFVFIVMLCMGYVSLLITI